jgi:hypothetical protein
MLLDYGCSVTSYEGGVGCRIVRHLVTTKMATGAKALKQLIAYFARDDWVVQGDRRGPTHKRRDIVLRLSVRARATFDGCKITAGAM